MLAEVENLKSQLAQSKHDHEREIALFQSDRDREVTAVLAEKTAVVSDSQAEVYRL